ncbi:hypothetical protein RCH13_002308 [Chryseobacterium sp. MP_3.2]|nr:hypothetical protein [Chryseobacterium sp. MP_3.2]
MKKLFLLSVFMLGSASLAFAKGLEVSPMQNKKIVEAATLISKKRMIMITTSCGNSYNVDSPNSWTSSQINTWIIGFDAGNCA